MAQVARDDAQCPAVRYRWCTPVAAGGSDIIRGIAARPDGGWIVVGAFNSKLDLGGGARTSRGKLDGFVLALDGSGAYQWDHVFGGVGDELPTDVTVAPDGTVITTGMSTDAVDLGGGVRSNAGGGDIFVLALTPNGRHAWDKLAAGPGYDSPRGVAIMSDGTIVIAGHVGDANGRHTNADGSSNVDGYVLALDARGRERWSYVVESPEWASFDSVTVAGTQIVSVGRIGTSSAMKGLVVALDATGKRVWEQRLGGNGTNVATDVTVTADGHLVVVGYSIVGSTIAGFVHALTSRGASLWNTSAPDSLGWVLTRGGAVFAGSHQSKYPFVIERVAVAPSGAFALGGYRTSGNARDLFVYVTDDPPGAPVGKSAAKLATP